MRWYFRPSLALPIKLLLFAWYVYAILFNLFYAYVHAISFLRLLFVTFPLIVGVLILPLYLALSIGTSLAPVLFSVVPFVMLPSIWTSEDGKKAKLGATLGAIIGFGILDALWNFGLGSIIGWMADFHPCEAWLAGVTGSIPPDPSCGH